MQENTEVKVPEPTEMVQPIPAAETEENTEQIHWKRFREARKEDRKQKEEAIKEAARKAQEVETLKAALASVVNKPTTQETEERDENEESRISRMVREEIEKRDRENEKRRLEQEATMLPQKLNQAYNDFDKVCSTENLDYLEYHYPEVASPYKHLPDSFEKWTNIYKAVKRFVPNPDSQKDQKKAEKNFSRPQSMASPSATSVGDTAPITLDDKRRSDNWARMQRIMKSGR